MAGIDEKAELMLEAARYCEGMYALAARAFSREMDAQTLAEILAAAVDGAVGKEDVPPVADNDTEGLLPVVDDGVEGAEGALPAADDASLAEPFDQLFEPESELLASLERYAGANLDEVARLSRSEYAELFVGPRPPLAPYYESLYLGYPHRLFSDQTRLVRSVYESNGFTVVERNRVPDDQLGYELEFVSDLCRSTLDAASDPERAVRLHETRMTFLRDHLAAWLPLFAERLEAASCADFYLAWTRFARNIAAADLRVGEGLAH